MQYLVYNRPYGKSGRRLAHALSMEAYVSHRRPHRSSQCGIAWAAHAPSALNGEISHSKLLQLQTWKDVSLTTLSHSLSMKQGWLGRTGSSHGGNDFLRNVTARYWTKPVMNVVREWRAHVCRIPGKKRGTPSSYRLIRLGYKVNEDTSLNRVVSGVHIRSRQFGWKLKYLNAREIPSYRDLGLQARWALAVLGWDFGAIDVLETEDGKYVLLEANSAPGLLDDKTLEAYRAALEGFLE